MTAIVGHDQSYIERPCVQRRMIDVDTSSVGIVEFETDKDTRDGVVESGKATAAAARFLAGWDWDEYRAKCPGTVDQEVIHSLRKGCTKDGSAGRAKHRLQGHPSCLACSVRRRD